MRIGLVCIVATIIAAAAPRTAFAQDTERQRAAGACSVTTVISAECLQEFDEWFKDELIYRKWMDLYRNKPSYSPWSGAPQKRRVRPTAPVWLSEYCAGTFQSDITSDQMCPRYNAVKDYDWLAERNHLLLTQLIQKKEAPRNTSFKQRIHLDVGYMAAEFPSPHVYGLIGMHVGLVPLGPCEVNVLPGSLLLRVPDGARGSKLQPSVTLGGGGCRLSKFKVPGLARYAVLHANVAEVHILGRSSEEAMLGGSNLTLMGFSITMK